MLVMSRNADRIMVLNFLQAFLMLGGGTVRSKWTTLSKEKHASKRKIPTCGSSMFDRMRIPFSNWRGNLRRRTPHKSLVFLSGRLRSPTPLFHPCKSAWWLSGMGMPLTVPLVVVLCGVWVHTFHNLWGGYFINDFKCSVHVACFAYYDAVIQVP